MERIIALTKPGNVKSRRVIEKIGLRFIDYREYFNMECAYYEVLSDKHID
jgi:RimJ/RimL family protein N-acetyltransferase